MHVGPYGCTTHLGKPVECIENRDISLEEKHLRYSNWTSRKKGIKHLHLYESDLNKQVSILSHIPLHMRQAFANKQRIVSTSASIIKRITRSTAQHLKKGKSAKHILDKDQKKKSKPSKHLLKVARTMEDIASLQKKQVMAARRVRIAMVPNTPPSIAKLHVQKLSVGMRSDHTMLSAIKKKLVKDRKEIFAIRPLPKGIKPEHTYPSPVQLQKRRAFGKPNLSRSYCVTPSLWHVIVIVWKNVCKEVAQNLAIALGKRGIRMLNKMRSLRRVDFSAL